MIRILPIHEPEVVDQLNDGRFEGDVQGYILMNGPSYLGHALFCVQDGACTVLDTGVEDTACLDGIVRACIAAGQNRGAEFFEINKEHPPLANWWRIFCSKMSTPAEIAEFFKMC